MPSLNRIVVFFAALSCSVATFAQSTSHLTNAENLVAQLRAQGEAGLFFDEFGVEYNKYGANWANSKIIFDDPAYVHGVCANFFTRLMMASYPGWSAKVMGFTSASPSAAAYHDAFEASFGGFTKVSNFHNWAPGDILAMKYFDGTDNSGHVMIIRDAIPGVPNAGGTIKWAVQVIDCSGSIHSNDTRVFDFGGGSRYVSSGAGMGWMYIWTKNGKILAYTWSQNKNSTLYKPDVRHMSHARLGF